jgi:hypothetical protein
MGALGIVLPWWARWLVLALAVAFVFMFGQMRGERIAGQRHIDYVERQAGQTAKIAKAQEKVVVQTEIAYRDRIQKIYVQGDVIEKEVPVYVTQADDRNCSINAGFVRSYDAAWAGEPAGPATESDREPAGVSLSEVGEADAFNAKVCRAWREQAIGLREFYQKLKLATNTPPAE